MAMIQMSSRAPGSISFQNTAPPQTLLKTTHWPPELGMRGEKGTNWVWPRAQGQSSRCRTVSADRKGNGCWMEGKSQGMGV